MKNEILQNDNSSVPGNENVTGTNSPKSKLDRRKFVEVVSKSALAFTIVPRHVLGGKNFVAPSDKITLAYIGVGTQGIRELLPLLANTSFHVIAVCDPNKDAVGYKDWAKDWLKSEIRKTINKPDWQPGGDNMIPGGRDCGKSIVDNFYSNVHPELKYNGCTAYADVRELLEKEKDLLVHKPLSNRLLEGKKVIEAARNSKVITHLIPWDSNGSMEQVMAWINAGAIGKLQEVHNWTNRPVWPQYPTLPTDTPPVPQGLDWDLWLGPEASRPYH